MKVLVIHNFHRKGSASGDDQVFNNEVELLREHGHQVLEYTVINDQFDTKNFIKKIFMTFGMLWSKKHFKEVYNLCKIERPDIVHVHTFFPLLSPSILKAIKKAGCKVVVTLHDTRFICPCATSLRNNSICNECMDGKYFRMVKHACFKNSKFQSFIVAYIFNYHRKKKTFYKYIDKYICLNEEQKRLLIDCGFEKNKIVKKYNFYSAFQYEITNLNTEKYDIPSRFIVYYGRIGEEKGIRFLMEAWTRISHIPLVVMGSGPLVDEFKQWTKDKQNIYFLGFVPHVKCLEIVKKSEFIVFPSIWYEGCSMVEIESEYLEKGIVATDLGFSKEAIIDGYNGYKYELNNIDEFVYKVSKLWNDPLECKRIGVNAKKDFEQKYTAINNYNQIISIYKEVIHGE